MQNALTVCKGSQVQSTTIVNKPQLESAHRAGTNASGLWTVMVNSVRSKPQGLNQILIQLLSRRPCFLQQSGKVWNVKTGFVFALDSAGRVDSPIIATIQNA